jgi:hypothetical protein
MSKQITFAELEKKLLDIGFIPSPAQGTQKVFVYPDWGALVVFPGYQKNDIVHPAHLISTRKALTENGLTSTDEFNDFCSGSEVSAWLCCSDRGAHPEDGGCRKRDKKRRN